MLSIQPAGFLYRMRMHMFAYKVLLLLLLLRESLLSSLSTMSKRVMYVTPDFDMKQPRCPTIVNSLQKSLTYT